MKGLKKLFNSALFRTSIAIGVSAFVHATAQGDVGRVLEQGSNSLHLPELHSTFSTTQDSLETIPEEEARLPLRRAWNLETPAGPTAYVLDRNKWELFGSINRIDQLLDNASPPLGAKYGLTHFLTMDAGLNFETLVLGLRWNFLNSKNWSFAFRPWSSMGAITSSKKGKNPWGIELSSSMLLSDYKRIHFSFEYGSSKSSDGYTGYYNSYFNSKLFQATRFVGSFETRFNPTYGMTFSIAPEWNKTNRNYSSSYWDYSTQRQSAYSDYLSDSYFSLLLGAGFHSWTEKMGYSLGFSIGPSWVSHSPTNSSYVTVAGAFSGGIHFRL